MLRKTRIIGSCRGTIEGLRHEELESWLQEATPLRFEHILKKQANGWGHVHFSTHYDASRFYNEMKDKTFTGPYDHVIRFSGATYFKSKKTVDYIIVGFLLDKLVTLYILCCSIYLCFFWVKES